MPGDTFNPEKGVSKTHKKENLSDTVLLEKVNNNHDADALALLFERHKWRVRNKVFLITRDPRIIDDILQDTFLEMHKYIMGDNNKQTNNFLGLLWRLSINSTFNYIRNNKNKPLTQKSTIGEQDESISTLFNLTNESPNPEDKVITDEQTKILHKHIDGLPPAQKDAILLMFEELSHEEIANKLNISPGTSKSNRNVGINKLKIKINGNTF